MRGMEKKYREQDCGKSGRINVITLGRTEDMDAAVGEDVPEEEHTHTEDAKRRTHA